MRVHPLHLCNGAAQVERLVRIEFGSEGVVSERGLRRARERKRQDDERDSSQRPHERVKMCRA
jgi:hypothetical protein